MGDVTPIDRFKQRAPDYVFECPCGSQHFYLHKDGAVECRSCKQIVEKIEWIFRNLSTPA